MLPKPNRTARGDELKMFGSGRGERLPRAWSSRSVRRALLERQAPARVSAELIKDVRIYPAGLLDASDPSAPLRLKRSDAHFQNFSE